jgi:D-aspartate ligase
MTKLPNQAPLPPVIIFGGFENALSLARSFASRPITVRALCERHSEVRFSRYARRIPLPKDQSFIEAATEFLLGPASDSLEGSVLLGAGDQQLEVIAEHREALAKKFQLDLMNPAAQEVMLDKLMTYDAAREAGVPTPKFWRVRSVDDIERLRGELVYPLIVKPKSSYQFQKRFKGKFFFANDFAELIDRFCVVESEGIEAVLVEVIPGPDSRLCSYYTYMDELGDPKFHFTKRIIRRYPVNMGVASYHITDHVDDVRELSLTLLKHVGLQGLATPEFKLDVRDNQLKLIECNVRFTAANCLVARAGDDLGNFVYNRIVGIPQSPLTEFRTGLRLWDPSRDLRAFLALRKSGELTLWQWLASICHPQVFPFFSYRDPMPALVKLLKRVGSFGTGVANAIGTAPGTRKAPSNHESSGIKSACE